MYDQYFATNLFKDVENCYLDKGIDGENDEFGLCLCIVHEVEVDEFLLLEIFGLHILEYVGEES